MSPAAGRYAIVGTSVLHRRLGPFHCSQQRLAAMRQSLHAAELTAGRLDGTPVEDAPSTAATDGKRISTTVALEATRPPAARYGLEMWQKRQIAQLGWDAFIKANYERMSLGSRVHSMLAASLRHGGTDAPDDATLAAYWRSAQCLLRQLRPVGDYVEKSVGLPMAMCTGRVDAIVWYEGVPHVLDWKTVSSTGAKAKSTRASQLYDDPVQLAAYAAYVNHAQRRGGADGGALQVDRALVALVHESGRSGHFVAVTPRLLRTSWQRFKERLVHFWSRIADGSGGGADVPFHV